MAYTDRNFDSADFGGDLSCTPDRFLFGTCSSGRFSDCPIAANTERSHIRLCSNEVPDLTLNISELTKVWKYGPTEPEEVVACDPGQIATGVCASGSTVGCQSGLFQTGLQCTQHSERIVSDTCYTSCGTFGVTVECSSGFAVTELCTSLGLQGCTKTCPESAGLSNNAFTAVRCCRFQEAGSQVTIPPGNTDGPIAQPSQGPDVTTVAVAAVGVGFAFAAVAVWWFRRYNKDLHEDTNLLYSKTKGGGGGGALASILGGSSVANTMGNSDTMTSYLKSNQDDTFLVNPDALELGPMLNKGGEGRVFRGAYAGSPVAVKEIMSSSHKLSDAFKREFAALKLIQHPHIIRLFGVCVKKSTDTGMDRYLLIMEMAQCSLRELISRSRTTKELTLLRALEFAKQIALGGAFIHAQDMLHLDIKPENILIDQSGDVKLCDLGLAQLCTSTDAETGQRQRTISMVGINGTPSYIAPERVQDFHNAVSGSPRHVSTAADVYSFGIVLWEMVHLRKSHPREWDGYKIIAEMKIRGYRPEISPSIPSGLAKTIRRCWVADPTLRPTFRDIAKRMEKLKKELFPAHPNSFTSNAMSRISKMMKNAGSGSRRKFSNMGAAPEPLNLEEGGAPRRTSTREGNPPAMPPRRNHRDDRAGGGRPVHPKSNVVALDRNGFVDLRMAQRSMNDDILV